MTRERRVRRFIEPATDGACVFISPSIVACHRDHHSIQDSPWYSDDHRMEATAQTIARDSHRRRRLALFVVCLGQLMIILDTTIVNVALPSIQLDLGFSQSSLTWVIDGYLITFGSLLLLAGRLGDILGRKRVFLMGVVTFTAASLLCGIAPSGTALVAARFLQGAAAALVSAVIIAIIAVE